MHEFQRMSKRPVTSVLGDAREKRFLLLCEVSIRDPHNNSGLNEESINVYLL